MTMDDPFYEIVGDLHIPEPDNVIDVSTQDTVQLVRLMTITEAELYDRGEAIDPKTARARELHSLRNAIQIELRQRAWRQGHNPDG